MNSYSNKKLTGNAQKLRRNMTKEERHLWYDFLKTLPITVNRQKVIGRYIVGFYCTDTKIAIELDGGQHYEEKGQVYDLGRDRYLRALELTVLRYSNADVFQNFEGVCTDILKHLQNPTLTTPHQSKIKDF